MGVWQIKRPVVRFGVVLLLALVGGDLAVGGDAAFSSPRVDVIILLQKLGEGVAS